MFLLEKDQRTYFEEHADDILKEKGISKAQFAKTMGVAPQNINKLFGTKNAITLSNIANYLNIPLQVLLTGNETKGRDIHGCVYVDGKPILINGGEDVIKLAEEMK